MPGGLVQRHVDAEDVGLDEELVELGHVSGHPGRVPGVVQDLHPEPRGAPGDGFSYSSVADQTQGGAVHVVAQVLVDAPTGPGAAAEVALCVAGEARRGQHEEERRICGGLVEHPGGVAYRDAQPARRLDIDVVVAHRHVRDDTEMLGRSRRQYLFVDAIGEEADQRVELRREPGQLGVGVGRVLGALHDFVAGVDEGVETTLGKPAGHEHPCRSGIAGHARPASGRAASGAINGWCSRSVPSPSHRWQSRSSGWGRGRSPGGDCGPCRGECAPDLPG